MYNQFFGFTSKPFHITPDLDFLFLGPNQKEALSCMEYGVMGDIGLTLIIGDIGTGKTTLVRQFRKGLTANIQPACIFNTNITPEQFLDLVMLEFGFTAATQSKAAAIKAVQTGLQRLRTEGRRPLLMIDDAQNLSLEALEEVRWLSNLQDDERMLVQIILVGQPELRTKLQKPSMASLAQRIGTNYHLQPFTRPETGKYIAHRLQTAGGKPDIFTKSAVDLIYSSSQGIPRSINLLCDNALVYAFADEKEMIDAQVIQLVIAELYPKGEWDILGTPMHKGTTAQQQANPGAKPSVDSTGNPQGQTESERMESLLETLEQISDDYAKELRSVLKYLLVKERDRYNKLHAEYLRVKNDCNELRENARTPDDDVHQHKTPAELKPTDRSYFKISAIKNEKGKA